jgi:DtxR family Mn-dependent transcriptional regulator
MWKLLFGLSNREAAYVRALKKFGGSSVKLKELAEELGVSTPSALEEVRHLTAKGLVENRRGHITLTRKGLAVLEALRLAHISLETIFARQDLAPEESCSSIHSFDYAIPESLVEKLYDAAGKPRVCPEGNSEC